VKSKALRRYFGEWIYQTFVSAKASQQININNHQRALVEMAIARGQFNIDTFQDAKREVLLLMETNMKAFRTSPSYRLCRWIIEATTLASLEINTSLQYLGTDEERNVLSEGSTNSSLSHPINSIQPFGQQNEGGWNVHRENLGKSIDSESTLADVHKAPVQRVEGEDEVNSLNKPEE
jgi:hypothetical protein